MRQCFVGTELQPEDEIIVSQMEHHANLVPWHFLSQRYGVKIKILPLKADGTLDLAVLPGLFDAKTRLLAITHVSNVLGTVNPIKEIIATAHQRGVRVLVDGAQAVAHQEVNVEDLDCDFYAFSGHKIYGPMGIGVLYGKPEVLESMPPYQGGGDMVTRVGLWDSEYQMPPLRFEAGTPNVLGAVGLAEA